MTAAERAFVDHDDLWRPSRWLDRPPVPRPTHWWHVAGIVALTAYANVIANRFLSDAWDIVFNLGVLAVAIGIARRSGLTWPEMGLRRDRIGRGVAVGLAAMAIVGGAVTVFALVPATRSFFQDERVAEASAGWLAFEVLVRIPIATAFYEEVLFRGVLFGMFARHFRPLASAILAAAIFGVWHVLPTIATLRTNPAGDALPGTAGVLAAVGGAVLTTFVAGLVFQWLRLRATSIVASVLAHIATNAFGLLAAYAITHLG